MRAALFLGERECVVRDFPDPEPGPGEVVVRMKVAAICGSDLSGYRQSREARAKRGEIIPGHEPCGVVEQVGPCVSGVQPGDRVVVYHYRGCGRCRYCRGGQMMWCQEARGYGSAIHGSDADFLLTDDRNCLPLPAELSFVDGAFVACIATTVWSVMKKLRPFGRDTMFISGLGPVGLTGVMMARAMGLRVLGADVIRERLELARELGAEEVIDAAQEDSVPAAVRRLTGGQGFDIGLECSGNAQAQTAIVEAAHRGGRIVFVAGWRGEKSISTAQLIGKQLTLMGSFVGPVHEFWELTEFMIERKLDLPRMVTHRFTIEQAAEAFRLFDTGRTGKVIFEWE